jgi:hypothetical protein
MIWIRLALDGCKIKNKSKKPNGKKRKTYQGDTENAEKQLLK